MAWATTDEVRQITGRSVGATDLAAAEAIVSTVVDRDPADTALYARLRPADQRRLRQAVAWQAVFLATNPDVLDRDDVASERFGDVTVDNRGDAAAVVLAPLARIAIKRLTWRRPRTIVVGTRTQHANRQGIAGVVDVPGEPWKPMR